MRILFALILTGLTAGNCFASDHALNARSQCETLVSDMWESKPVGDARLRQLHDRLDEKALPACELAAVTFPDDPKVMYWLGRALLQGEQKDRALEWLLRSAEAEYVPAQALYGMQFWTDGVAERDVDTAFFWLDKAGESGHIVGMAWLGLLYLNSDGVQGDLNKSLDLILPAAERGYERALYSVGWFVERGVLDEADWGPALNWYRASAEQGVRERQYRLGAKLLETKDPAYMDEAIGWLVLAAEQGEPWAYYDLGHAHSQVASIRDYAKAVDYLEQGVALGSRGALGMLAWHYREGLGVEKDATRSFGYFFAAATAGDPYSAQVMGSYFEAGYMVPKDQVLALSWYRQGAEGGRKDAQVELARLLIETSAPDQLEEAIYWLEAAVSRGSYQGALMLARFRIEDGQYEEAAALLDFASSGGSDIGEQAAAMLAAEPLASWVRGAPAPVPNS